MTLEADAPRWWHFSHGADIGVAGSGHTIEQAFEQAALAMTAVVTEAPVHAAQAVTIHCEAPDQELLLVDWLNALIYEMSVREMLFGRYAVRIAGHALTASAAGEPLAPSRHQPAVEIKGATYTGLSVARGDNGVWIARCVIDV